MGWAEIDNGTLIRAAQQAGFAIVITCDRNIRYQQDLTGSQFSFWSIGGAAPRHQENSRSPKKSLDFAQQVS